MNVWDSELLIKKADNQPVANGLILWIDGRDIVQSGKSFLDRISGTNIPSVNSQSWTVANDQDGLHYVMSTSASSTLRFRSENTFPNAGAIEVVRKIDSDEIRCGIIQGSEYYGRVKAVSSGVSYSNSNASEFTIQSSTQPQHIVAQAGVIYINGIPYTTNSKYNSVSFGAEVLICRCYGQLKTMKFGAIRVYNRALTEDEILNNYAYEQNIGRIVL